MMLSKMSSLEGEITLSISVNRPGFVCLEIFSERSLVGGPTLFYSFIRSKPYFFYCKKSAFFQQINVSCLKKDATMKCRINLWPASQCHKLNWVTIYFYLICFMVLTFWGNLAFSKQTLVKWLWPFAISKKNLKSTDVHSCYCECW